MCGFSGEVRLDGRDANAGAVERMAACMARRDSGRVLFARDRLGIKPLYLSESRDRVRFASTLPPLLAGVRPTRRSIPPPPAPRS